MIGERESPTEEGRGVVGHFSTGVRDGICWRGAEAETSTWERGNTRGVSQMRDLKLQRETSQLCTKLVSCI